MEWKRIHSAPREATDAATVPGGMVIRHTTSTYDPKTRVVAHTSSSMVFVPLDGQKAAAFVDAAIP